MEPELELELESELEPKLELESSLPPAILHEGNENSQEVQAILEINGMEQVPKANSQQLLYNHLSKPKGKEHLSKILARWHYIRSSDFKATDEIFGL